ncbi:hypothetical protein D5086_014224 [Populus alba]|uniref:Uncharacterized protein n=1 Tax=Populus alba TaxID=43335 RepID=A0ACC4BWW5_POPAL
MSPSLHKAASGILIPAGLDLSTAGNFIQKEWLERLLFDVSFTRTKRGNPQDSNEVIVEFSSAVPWLQRFLVLEASSSSLI